MECVATADFSVDELFDFSNENDLWEEQLHVEEDAGSLFRQGDSHVSPAEDLYDPIGDLDFPVNDVANLEWLSHFVDDSNADYGITFPREIQFPKEEDEPHAVPVFKHPAKSRSKRARPEARVRPVGAASPESPSSSVSSTVTYSGFCTKTAMRLVELSSKGKQTKKNRTRCADGATAPRQIGGRRCSHCGVQKTPQWRAGPLGAKTLCNACGVRYKSGRLLPEYRPACSPTFSSELHSNSHRKVLEMRRRNLGDSGEMKNTVSYPIAEPGS